MLKLDSVLNSYPLSAVARQDIYEAVDDAVKLEVEREVNRVKDRWAADLDHKSDWVNDLVDKLDQFLELRCDAEFAELREDIERTQAHERDALRRAQDGQ